LVLATKIGTTHLTISACVAPFLLLRTDNSTRLGLIVAKTLLKPPMEGLARVRADGRLGCVFLAALPLFPIWIALVAILARIAATVVSTLQHPIVAFPRNWWRFVARIDSVTVPEAIPGAAESQDPELTAFNTLHVIRSMWAGEAPLVDRLLVFVLGLFPYGLFVFLPSLLYRWSVKGTSLVYSPLIYVARSSFSGSIREKLQDLRELALHRIARYYAAFVVLLFGAKMFVFFAWAEMASEWARLPARTLIEAYVVPREIPPWQLASFVAALLAWALFFIADFTVVRLSRTDGWTTVPSRVAHLTQSLLFIRGVLGIYSIVCVLYISASLVPELAWPPLGSKLFPW
jgi:hypothetical protein